MATAAAAAEVVGREEELAAVARFLDAVADGPRALIFEGEAGIGKTTIWNHGVALARERLGWVLTCRPTESETAFAYSSLGDLFRDVLSEPPQLARPQRKALEVALLRTEGNADPHAVSAAVLSVLRALAGLAPVVIAIDDVQWLDRSTAGALDFALRRVEAEPVLALTTLRIGTKRVPLDLDHSLAPRLVERRVIGPLGVDALAQLLRSRLDVALERSTLVRVHRASGGNPFFALEIARAVRDGRMEHDAGELPLPENLRDLVRSRLARLPAETRAVLLIAAALSQPTLELIEGVAGARKARAIVKAEEADVVVVERDRIRFTHPLLAAALYAEASRDELRNLHRTLATVVSDPEERARHLAQATTGADESVASALETAARRARSRGAYESATELADEAWRLTPADDTDAVQRRKIDAVQLHALVGDYAYAKELAEEAIDGLTPGPLRARALVELGLILQNLERWDDAFRTIEQALEEAGDNPVLRATTERQLGATLAGAHFARRAEPHLRRALDLAEKVGDRVLLAEALAAVAFVDMKLGNGLRSDLIARALALDTFYEHARFQRIPYWQIAHVYFYAGELAKAEECLDTLLHVANERGEEAARPWILWFRSEIECQRGNWNRAEQLVAEAREAALQTGQDAVRYNARDVQMWLDARLGRVEPVRALEREIKMRYGVWKRHQVAFLELSLGNPGAAVHYFDHVLMVEEEQGVGEPAVFKVRADAIETFVAVGRLDDASRLVDDLEEHGRTFDQPWSLATGARCRALLLAARQDLDEALAAAERAVREHERLPMPFERARTLLVKGTVERRTKQKRAARESLREALRIFEELGAVLWAQKARDELARIGGRASAEGLTPTERQIVDLVAAGSTNREVAEAMFISVKTVEANLSRIYRKLGVSSRRELARHNNAQT